MNRITTSTLALTLTTLLAATLVATAQAPGRGNRFVPARSTSPAAESAASGTVEQPARRLPPLVAALDANQDGELDAAEIANAATALKALDTNGDGKLTKDELHPGRPGGATEGRGHGPRGRKAGAPPESTTAE